MAKKIIVVKKKEEYTMDGKKYPVINKYPSLKTGFHGEKLFHLRCELPDNSTFPVDAIEKEITVVKKVISISLF